MKKLLLTTLLLALSHPVIAADKGDAKYVQACTAEAESMGVAPEDMEVYVADCVDAMKEEERDAQDKGGNNSHE